jgi:hypothetical protein
MTMLKAKHIFFLFSAILLIGLFYRPVIYQLKPFVELFYEGTSLGKTYAFLIWMSFLFGVLAVKEREKLSFENRNYFSAFLKVAAVAFAFAVIGHAAVFYVYHGSLPGPFSVIATMTSEQDTGYWEASTFGHIHFSKIALFLFDFLSPDLHTDNGMPFFRVTPFALPLSIAIWVFIILLLRYALLESLSSYTNRVRGSHILWAIAAFGIMVAVVDGGPFSVVSQFSLGLFLYYSAAYKLKVSGRQILYALSGLFLILAILRFLVAGEVFVYGLALAGIISALLTARLFSLPRLQKTLFVLLAAAFLLISHTQISGILSRGSLEQGQEVVLFVYGLPLSSGSSILDEAISESFSGASVYTYGYIALIEGTPSADYRGSSFSSFLQEKINASGYLNASRIKDGYSGYDLSSPAAIRAIEECSSPLVSFERRPDSRTMAVRSALPMHYTALYTLNCLIMDGEENPVVTLNGNPYI